MDYAIGTRQELIGNRPRRGEKIKTTLCVIALLCAWGFVSEMDYQDAVAVQQERSACWSK